VGSSDIAPLLHSLEDPLSIDIVDRLLPRSHVLSSSDPLLTPYSLLFFSSSIVSFNVSNCFIRDRSWSTSEAWKKQSHIIGSLNSDGQQFHKYQQNESEFLTFESHKIVVSSNLSVGPQPNQLNGNSNDNTYINKQLIIYIHSDKS